MKIKSSFYFYYYNSYFSIKKLNYTKKCQIEKMVKFRKKKIITHKVKLVK